LRPIGSGVDDGRKRHREDRVAAVQNGDAHSCLVLPGVHGDAAFRGPCLKTSRFRPKSWLKKIFGIFLPGPLQFIFARIIISGVADESL